jgi:hypothetical protein
VHESVHGTAPDEAPLERAGPQASLRFESLAFLERHDACSMSPGATGLEETIVFYLATCQCRLQAL